MSGVESSKVIYLAETGRAVPQSATPTRAEVIGYIEAMAGTLAVMATNAGLTEIARHFVEAQSSAQASLERSSRQAPSPDHASDG